MSLVAHSIKLSDMAASIKLDIAASSSAIFRPQALLPRAHTFLISCHRQQSNVRFLSTLLSIQSRLPLHHQQQQSSISSSSHRILRHHHVWHENLINHQQQHHLVAKDAKVAVVLLGWLGAEQKHLRRYAEWYNSRGIHAVTFVLPMSDLIDLNVIAKSDIHVTNLYNNITQWLSQQDENTPPSIFFHTFSNTGWLTYGALLERFYQHHNNIIPTIKGCIVDSAPVAELNPQVWAAGFSAALLKKRSSTAQITNVKPSMSERATISLLKNIFSLFLVIPPIKQRLSEVIQTLSRRQPLNSPQLYMYSTADKVIPSECVESFMEQQKIRGYQVYSCNMQNSPHVDHLRSNPSLYSHNLHSFIQMCLSPSTNAAAVTSS